VLRLQALRGWVGTWRHALCDVGPVVGDIVVNYRRFCDSG
jgi:hypothetical protein